MAELKPCPFCGIEPAIWSGSYLSEPHVMDIGPGGYYIGHSMNTSKCPMTRPAWFEDKERAIAAWNRRAEPAGWVRVEDRLPEKHEWVLVATSRGDRFPALRTEGEPGWKDWDDGPEAYERETEEERGVITHWRPLPAPPAEPGEEG